MLWQKTEISISMVVANSRIPSFSWLNDIPANMSYFLYPLTLDGHSSCVHIVAIVTNAAMNTTGGWISPHTSHLLGWLSPKDEPTRVSEDVEKRPLSCTVGKKYKWVQLLWKQYGSYQSLKKYYYCIIQQSNFWVYIQRQQNRILWYFNQIFRCKKCY